MRKVLQGIAGVWVALSVAACSSKEEPPPPPVEVPVHTPQPGPISGTVTVPEGVSLEDTELVACYLVNNVCDSTAPQTRWQLLRGLGPGTSAAYTFENLAPGSYLLAAAKDTNGNGTLDSGDFRGLYTRGGTSAVSVSPPAQGINLALTVYGGGTASGLSGTVLAPSGGTISGVQVVACFLSEGVCVPGHANTRQVAVSVSSSTRGTYSFPALAPGQYVLLASKDVNANNQLDDGDYEGFYTTGGTRASPVTPPAQGFPILLKVRGGGAPGTPPPGVTFLRPADFTGGSATVTLTGLSSTERVAVIPVHASQSSTVDGLGFSLTTSGVAAQSLAAVEARPRVEPDAAAFEPVASPSRLQDAHLARLDTALRGAERLRQAGVRPLGARGRVRAQALDNCPAPYTVDTRACPFWISADPTSQTRITATLKHESAHAYWFVQNEDLAEFSSADLKLLADEFENRVIPADNQYFGDFPDVDQNGKIFIVFSRLLGPHNLLGYVLPLDLYDDADVFPTEGAHSNEGDIFYAATPSSLPGMSRSAYFRTVMPSTMVHELKHLIATGRRLTADHPPEEIWIEEGSAVAAQQLAGMGAYMNEVQGYAGLGLGAPQSYRVVYAGRPASMEENVGVYGYNFLFLWRAAQAKGHEAFWKDWAAGPGTGIANLEAHTGKPFAELMLDWAAALALDHANLLPGYDYDTFSLRDGSWEDLGYRPLQSSVTGTARSMAYYVGRGTGSTASITLQATNAADPYAVVLRLPGALPWSASQATVTVRGTVSAPAGGTLASTIVETCHVAAGLCDWKSSLIRNGRFSSSATAASSAYYLTMLPDQYAFFASKDVNGDGKLGAGDYFGCFTQGGSACATVNVIGDRGGVDISMSVLTGPPGITLQSLPPEWVKPAHLLGTRAMALQVLGEAR